MKRASVSVIVPCYGQSATLDRTLASVNAQTLPPLEVIVIDDGSAAADGETTQRIAHSYGAKCIRITNRGLAAARNVGLMNARGSALLPVDSDDWLAPTYLERTVPLLIDADVVVPGIQEHGTRNGEYPPGFDTPIEEVSIDLMWTFNRCYYASLYRRNLLLSVGGWNPKMDRALEDYDLHMDLMIRGARYVGCYETLFHYSTADDSMLMRAHRDGGFEAMLGEMKRHHFR